MARWPGGHARGARWPGDQARCEVLHAAVKKMRKPAAAAAAVFFFFLFLCCHCPGWLWLGGTPPRVYLPEFATLTAQSTRHGARPTLASWCPRAPPACPTAKSARKDPRPEERSWPRCTKKSNWVHGLPKLNLACFGGHPRYILPPLSHSQPLFAGCIFFGSGFILDFFEADLETIVDRRVHHFCLCPFLVVVPRWA